MRTIILTISSVLLFTGCSFSSQKEIPKTKKVQNKKLSGTFSESRVLPYDNIVDRGQYAEVWIAPYKDKDGNLFNERRMNFWVEMPDFIIGEELPDNKKLHISKKTRKNTFSIKPSSLNKIQIDNEVLKYLNK